MIRFLIFFNAYLSVFVYFQGINICIFYDCLEHKVLSFTHRNMVLKEFKCLPTYYIRFLIYFKY